MVLCVNLMNIPGNIQSLLKVKIKETLDKPLHRALVGARFRFQCFGFEIALILRPLPWVP
jgi:hypothetical protein